jgi:hypothetical protein
LRSRKLAEIGVSVANVADPAKHRQVAEGAARALDIRLQQENRLAVAPPFLLAGLADGAEQALPPPGDALAEKVREVVENRRAPGYQPGFDQRRANGGVAGCHAAGLPYRAHAVA